MYNRAKYLGNRFIRNAIGGIILSGMIIYFTSNGKEPFKPITIVIPVLTCLWLYLGIQIKTKLKNINPDADEITDEIISSRTVHFLLGLCAAALIFSSLHKIKYVDYFAAIIFVGYAIWLIAEIRKVFKFLKENTSKMTADQ